MLEILKALFRMKKRFLLMSLLACSMSVQAMDLLESYDLAMQNDPTLQEAEETRNAVLESRPQSLARLLPSLSLVGGINANRYDTTNTFAQSQFGLQYFWDSNVSLKLSQPIYHHDYWVQLDQSDNQIAQAEAEYVAEQQNLLLRTAKAYFGVLLAQNSLEYANAEQQTVERQVQEMQRRLMLGAASIDELQEAQSGYDQARAISIEAQRELQAAQTALTEIIGPADHELNPLRPDIKPLLPEPDQMDDWMTLARQNNLALIAAQHRAEVARKTIEIQFAGHLPTLDLVGNLATTDTDRTQGVEANSQTIGVQMNMPLYLGGSVDSKVRQAQHQFEAARKHIDKQRRAAERQAQDAFQGIASTIDQIKALESAQRSTEITVEAIQKGLQVGSRSMSELLLVNRNLFRVRRDHAKAKYDYIVNCLTLKQAAGMLVRGDLELVNAWLVGR